jgi:hypothetical protein
MKRKLLFKYGCATEHLDKTEVAKGQKHYCIITNCKRFLTSAKIRKTASALLKCLGSRGGGGGIGGVGVGDFRCQFWL